MHPLGKSPVITDGDVTIAESGAIVDYIIRRYGKGAMMPAPGSADYEAYNEWLHYSEGSAMLPLMLNLYVSPAEGGGAPLHPRIDSELANHLGYVDGALKGRDFFVGRVADRRRYPDELCRRDGKGVRQARPVSEPRGLAGAHARPAGVPALGREGRGVPVCVSAASFRAREAQPGISRFRADAQMRIRGSWAPAHRRGDGAVATAAWEPPSSPPYLA